MSLILFVLIFCFFIFLYVLYYFSHDDFVVIRKDITMERIFNLAFVTGVVSLFSSRLFFALFSNNPKYLNPLVFFALPYFPGLSLIGGLLGGSILIYWYCNFKKLPIGKMFDLFIKSFILVLPVGFLLTYVILLFNTSLFFNILFISSIIFLVLFIKVIFPFSSKGEVEDGSAGLIFMAVFSLLYFLTKMFLDIKNFSFLELENIVLLISLFSSLILLINLEIMDKFLRKR